MPHQEMLKYGPHTGETQSVKTVQEKAQTLIRLVNDLNQLF